MRPKIATEVELAGEHVVMVDVETPYTVTALHAPYSTVVPLAAFD